MDVVGFARIKENPSGTSAISMDNFSNKTVRVLEYTADGCVLVLDDAATGLATFEKEDILFKFKASIEGGVIVPPNLSIIDKIAYTAKCHMRKGGYNRVLMNMVIAASLAKGEFTDNFLWQKQ